MHRRGSLDGVVVYPTVGCMTNNSENNLTKAQRRTRARRAKRTRETQGREAPTNTISLPTKSPAAPTYLGGLSSAERRALSRVPALTQREIGEIRETNKQAAAARFHVQSQRDSRRKI